MYGLQPSGGSLPSRTKQTYTTRRVIRNADVPAVGRLGVDQRNSRAKARKGMGEPSIAGNLSLGRATPGNNLACGALVQRVERRSNANLGNILPGIEPDDTSPMSRAPIRR